jgi:hypothetical protein
VEIELHTFLTSVLYGGESSGTHSGRFTLFGERASGTHLIGGWVSPRAGPEAVRCQKSNPGRPACGLVIILTELSQLPLKKTSISVVVKLLPSRIMKSGGNGKGVKRGSIQ